MTLEAAIARILALRDSEASRNLCADLEQWRQEHGEADALKLAAVVEEGVRRYVRYENAIRTLVPGQRMKL
jgi:hypothetical protein